MTVIGKMMELMFGALSSVRNGMRKALTGSQARLASDRGDVPGWVLVTVMTAGLVTGLWMVADDQLTSLLSKAINSVSN
jgi:hypothetical protein